MRTRTRLVAILISATVLTARTSAAPPSGEQATATLTASPRHGEWVDLALPDGTNLHTWVAYPERADRAPVVLVIHEIFGMSDWVRATADALAAEGYIAIAPDMLSGKGPNGGNTDAFAGDAVRAAIGTLAPDDVALRLNVARDYARTLPSATERLGTIGFCWGGTQTFNYAIRQPDLHAAVVYYGTAPVAATDAAEQIAKIRAPVLGQYGGDDARVTSTVEPTRTLMQAAGKAYEPIVHAGAGHGFLRQQAGKDGANAKAADAAWSRTISFLREHLETPAPK